MESNGGGWWEKLDVSLSPSIGHQVSRLPCLPFSFLLENAF
jgi:hypothetical protein